MTRYSDESFWVKLKRYAIVAGREVVERALTLYHVARDSDTPTWAKTVIYGALGYFIAPLDAVPDFTPIVGYSDDLLILSAAVATVALHITPEVRAQARHRLDRWFAVRVRSRS